MQRYVRAVEERDLDTLYALTDPREYQRVPLTRKGLEQAFAAMFETPVVHHEVEQRFPYRRQIAGGTQHEFFTYWLDKRTRKPLPGKSLSKRKRPQAWSFLKVRPTPAGWRVATTSFLLSTSKGRWGSSERFKAAAWKAGIRYLLSDVPGRSIVSLFKQAGVGSQAQP